MFRALQSTSGPVTDVENSVQIDALTGDAILPQTEGAQLQSILYTTAQNDFVKFTSCRTIGAQKLVHSEPLLLLSPFVQKVQTLKNN